MTDLLKRFIHEEEGQGMAEYGLILALVAIVVIGALTVMGEQIRNKFNEVATELGFTPEPEQ